MAQWNLRGVLLGACSCDWGCPCSFNARPTQGFCEGGYVWHVKSGTFDGVKLDGLTFSWLGHSPGPMHEGNVTAVVVAGGKATPQQRGGIEDLTSGKHGGAGEEFCAGPAQRFAAAVWGFAGEGEGMERH